MYPAFDWSSLCSGQRLKLATEVMRTDTGLHADQARWQVAEPCLHLAARPLLAKPIGAAIIERPTICNEFLLISMPVVAVCAVAGMACSLSWRPLAQLIVGGAGARPEDVPQAQAA
jgi:hypothetical protein